jgi:hypothetical protein
MKTARAKRPPKSFDVSLYRDRIECSLDLYEIPVAPENRQAHWVNAIGLGFAALTICAGGFLTHIVR